MRALAAFFARIKAAWCSPVRYGGGQVGVSLKDAKRMGRPMAKRLNAHWESEMRKRSQ